MRKRLALAALAAALLTGAPAGAQDVVRIGTEAAYLPYNGTDASGRIIGFEVDMGQELCRRIGITCEFVSQDWDGIIPSLLGGRYDMIIAAMTVTAEREKQVAFTQAYVASPTWFVAAKDSALAAASTIDAVRAALAGLTVGVQRSTIQHNFMEEQLPDVPLSLYDTQDDLNLDLLAGRVDAAIADSSGWQPFLASEDGKAFAPFGPGLTGDDFPVLGGGVAIAFRPDEDTLRGEFDAAIDTMQADGSLAALSVQWFGYDISTK
jgi:lysine-arginine-ornithine-binding protein